MPVIAALACLNIELLEPTVRITAATGSIQLADADSIVIEIDFSIDPGTDAAARPLPMPDRTLRIENQSLQPVDSSFGTQIYRAVIRLPATRTRQAIAFSFPAVPDANAARFDLSIPILSRIGSDRILLNRGADLMLESRRARPLESGIRSSWILQLRPTCNSGGQFAELQAMGEPPESITIPRALLETVAPATFEACLRFHWSGTIRDGGYPLTLQSVVTLVWKIEINRS